MTDKQIIIDGKKEKVNILFECNHIEDIEAFDMIKQGIEITPQNAPVGDFKIKIISNIHSPYGFSSICSKSKKSEDWEYMGFGHSGACSVTTALLKALQRKEQECEELKKELDKEHLLMLEKQDKATRYFLVLNGIKEYIYNNTDFDVNDSIQSKTSGYDILQMIKDV